MLKLNSGNSHISSSKGYLADNIMKNATILQLLPIVLNITMRLEGENNNNKAIYSHKIIS